ncbi:uncharacterized protein [Diadema antillarum]|uniref:uncharacterized protein isoform X2 n=1 Tax=Diadema antillarum TaxID=105358 RepID=UPI003A85417A
MDRRYYLVLLLTLTTTVFCGNYGEASVVGTAPNVKGWKGEDVLLRCDIKKEPVVVQWVKEKISDQQQRTVKAGFIDGHFFSREERFDVDKNFSLAISSLEMADEGRYYCLVVLKNSQSFGNSTIMTISSMASGHTIKECAARIQSRQSRCTYQSPSNTHPLNFTCVVSGFKPNVSMLWTEESGKRIDSVVSRQRTLSDGTYERFETIIVLAEHGTEQTFMCVATGDSLNGESTREITVLPLSVSGKRVNFALIIGLIIGVPVVIVVLFLSVGKYLQSKHPDYLPRKGCGWNPCWRRPNKPQQCHEESECLRGPNISEQCHEESECLRGSNTPEPCHEESECLRGPNTPEQCHEESECLRGPNIPEQCHEESECLKGPNTPEQCHEESECLKGPNTSEQYHEEIECLREPNIPEQCHEESEGLRGPNIPDQYHEESEDLREPNIPEQCHEESENLRGPNIPEQCHDENEYLRGPNIPERFHEGRDFLRRPNIPEKFHEKEELMLKSSSLTKEQVQQCKEDLKAYYRVSRSKVTVDPLDFMERVELDDIYTNLSIIDQSSKRKIPITYDDLLTNNENGYLSKRLLIQGEGSVGKTTLCAKIAWDWCQGRILRDLDMVLLIPLRDIKNATSIGGIVKTYLSHSNTTTKNKIDDYISTNLSRVLIIFDGFDEFDEKLSKTSTSEVIRILETEQYNSCKVIVTTRPWRTNEFKMDKSLAETYTFLNVEGFNKANLSTYVKRYFRIREKDNLAENLISFMQENDVIQSNMAPFPIYCAMLCLLWNDFSEERRREMQKLHTFSQIFGEMISFLKEHYASKICENLQNHNIVEHLKEAGRAILEISKIALDGLFDRNLSFPDEQFRECHDAMVTCCRVGVLTIEKDVITRERRRDVNISSLVTSTVSFPHKLFQEYIAGVYIQYLFANDRAKYDNVKNKLFSRPKEFRYVLYFTSASGNELGLDIIKGLINCPSYKFTSDPFRDKENEKRDFCVDIVFECHTEEAAKAVGEGWNEYRLLSNTPEHTVSGVVFMVRYNQVKIKHRCGLSKKHDKLFEELFSGDGTVCRDMMDVCSPKL